MKKQVKLTAKSENTCKEVYEQSPDFHQCGRFCQMQCCSIRAPRRPYGQNGDFWDLPVKAVPDYGQNAFFWDLPVKSGLRLFLLISITEGDCHAYAKTGLDLQSTANQPVFHFEPYFPHHSKKYSAYFILPSLYHSTVLTPFLPKSSLLIFPSMTFLPGLSLSPSEALPLTLYESK